MTNEAKVCEQDCSAGQHYDKLTDKLLLAAIADGDEKALEQLYERYSSKLLGVAIVILHNRQDAEDLIHDVFLNCWHKATHFKPERGSVYGWLLISTRNRALDRLRALARIRASTDKVSGIENQPDIAALIFDAEKACDAMRKLSDKQRTVIELCYFQGMTHSEIAVSCGIALGTVKSRMAAAIIKLRQQLNPVSGESNG